MPEEPTDDDVPVDELRRAAAFALAEGKPAILKKYGLIVVPDVTVLRAMAGEMTIQPTQTYDTTDGRTVLVYRYTDLPTGKRVLEGVDQVDDDETPVG